MKVESVRAFKQEIADEIRAAAADHDAETFFAATEDPMPSAVALGIARQENGEHVVAIRSADPVLASALAARAHGEADVRVLRVVARNTPGFYQGRVRPLEPGAQLNIVGKNFVGTLGAIVRDARAFYCLTNSHVAADLGRTPIGTLIAQPFAGSGASMGVLDRFVPLSPASPNLVDCALVRIDGAAAVAGFNAAVAGNVVGAREVTPDDLGREVTKVGRTTGIRRGKITAVEVDGLPVGMDPGLTMTFNDQIEVSGGPATDFSAGGDSGSLIVTPDGVALALLFAGGRDSSGEDFTFGNRATTVLRLLGVTLP